MVRPRLGLSKIRKAARNQECTLRITNCSGIDTTVLAHIRTPNTGLGLKPIDTMAVFACASCHDILDGRNQNAPISENEILSSVIRAMSQTHSILIDKRLIVLK